MSGLNDSVSHLNVKGPSSATCMALTAYHSTPTDLSLTRSIELYNLLQKQVNGRSWNPKQQLKNQQIEQDKQEMIEMLQMLWCDATLQMTTEGTGWVQQSHWACPDKKRWSAKASSSWLQSVICTLISFTPSRWLLLTKKKSCFTFACPSRAGRAWLNFIRN